MALNESPSEKEGKCRVMGADNTKVGQSPQ